MEETLRPVARPAPETPVEKPRLLETAEERFVAVSVALTGFDHVDLVGTGVTSQYLATLEKWVGPNITAELLQFGTAPPPDDFIVRTCILGDSKLGPVARNVIQLWYTGVWNPLTVGWYVVYRAEIPNPPNLAELPTAYVVSPDAYIESLVWTAANTHPMGAKQPGFGTWSDPPKGAKR